ncbi:hypothetical protein MRX96_013273 [Rhipicephalus microplus]
MDFFLRAVPEIHLIRLENNNRVCRATGGPGGEDAASCAALFVQCQNKETVRSKEDKQTVVVSCGSPPGITQSPASRAGLWLRVAKQLLCRMQVFRLYTLQAPSYSDLYPLV